MKITFKYFITFLCLPIFGIAQTISGKVYNEQSTIQDVRITNLTQKKTIYTNSNGNFKIPAAINDSIQFSASFYEVQILVVKSIHFDEIFVIELKRMLNELDEVLLSNQPKEKEFNAKEESIELQNLIKEDIKNRPYLYGAMSSTNMDIFAVIGLVAKLFKNKKPKKTSVVPIDYNGFKELFGTSDFFNESLLNNTLKIPQEHQFLFFDYCSEKEIDSKLLSENNGFLLLEELMKSSKEFLALLEVNKKKK